MLNITELTLDNNFKKITWDDKIKNKKSQKKQKSHYEFEKLLKVLEFNVASYDNSHELSKENYIDELSSVCACCGKKHKFTKYADFDSLCFNCEEHFELENIGNVSIKSLFLKKFKRKIYVKNNKRTQWINI